MSNRIVQLPQKKSLRVLLPCLYFLVVTAIGLWVLESAAGRLIQKEMLTKLAIFQGIMIDDRNVLAIKPQAKLSWSSPGFTVDVRTNRDGYREDFDFNDQDVLVAFMGDSFSFGHGVNVEQRYSNIVAQQFPPNTVVSLAYNNGFQPEHYEYFLQHHPQLKPTSVVLGLYLGNDLESDVRETEIERDAIGEIASLKLPLRSTYGDMYYSVPNRFYWYTWLVERYDLAKIISNKINRSLWRIVFTRFDQELPDDFNSYATEMGNFAPYQLRVFDSLSNIRTILEARGTRLKILLIPQNYMVGNDQYPHISELNREKMQDIRKTRGLIKAVIEQCSTRKLDCHDLSTILIADDYMVDDGHWNVAGHAKVGHYIGQQLQTRTPPQK